MFSGTARAEHHNFSAFNSTFELQNIIKRADAHSQQAQYQQVIELLTQAYQASESLADNTLRNDVINAMANV